MKNLVSKQLKKCVAVVFAIMMCANVFAHDFQVDGIYYNINSGTTTVEVTHKNTNYNSYSGSVVIPSTVTYNGTTYSVTSIGSSAFSHCTSLTSITIPNSVTSIGNYAFSGCTGFTSITIPNSVTSIGYSAFSNCTSLTSITIPNSVTSIGGAAFKNCTNLPVENNVRYADSYLVEAVDKTLTTYIIKAGTRFIGDSAFKDCTNLTSITIPNGITSIGEYAFSHCTSLTSITIPNSVTSIGNNAFEGCTSLPVENNVRYADSYLVEAVDKTLTTYTIKAGTRFIGDTAFKDCANLTSITIPESIAIMGNGAFAGCTNLTTINYNAQNCSGPGFSGGGTNWLYSCGHITTVNIGNNVEYIPPCFVRGEPNLTSIIIPNSVTSIGEYAFSDCTGLTSVTIPNSVTSIGSNAFSNCTGLTSVTIPNSVTSIGSNAFSNCTGLTSVTIPNSVTSIGSNAFNKCTGLTFLAIGNSVDSIGDKAFYKCSGLNTIDCKAENPPVLGTTVFGSINKDNVTLIVPCEKSSLYQNATGWSLFNNIVEDCESSIDVVEENQILVYPNPAKDNITLEADEDVFIFNNLGQIVKQVNNPKGKTIISVADLPKGTYYLKAGEKKQKLVINK